MAWGQDEPAKAPVSDKSRFATPPSCPRCELTKSQMNRTIQNYQKAYRKKVEGLKQELSTTRSDNTHLRSQVRRLRKKRLLHAPSILIGAAVGLFANRMVRLLRQHKQQNQHKQQPAAAPDAQQGAGEGPQPVATEQ